MRILYVEDQIQTAAVMRLLLERNGHQVMTANDARHAKALCADHIFDVWIMDIDLPDDHGGELLRSMRRMTDTPAIALTGCASKREIEEGKDDGFDEYLLKPVKLADVLAAAEGLAPAKWHWPPASLGHEQPGIHWFEGS